MREALFSILGPLDGQVLDLYAGSGALGLEALSRGATRAVFVESRRPALDAILGNIHTLNLNEFCEVIPKSVERSLSKITTVGPFSLILADPPYTQVEDQSAVRAVDAILQAGVLAPNGLFVLEHDARSTPAITALSLQECRRYGDTCLSIYHE